MKFQQEYYEILKKSINDKTDEAINEGISPRIPLAYLLFENMIENASDKDLDDAYNSLQEWKQRNKFSNLNSIPFAKDVMSLIEDQYNYRHMHDEENSRASHTAT